MWKHYWMTPVEQKAGKYSKSFQRVFVISRVTTKRKRIYKKLIKEKVES